MNVASCAHEHHAHYSAHILRYVLHVLHVCKLCVVVIYLFVRLFVGWLHVIHLYVTDGVNELLLPLLAKVVAGGRLHGRKLAQ